MYNLAATDINCVAYGGLSMLSSCTLTGTVVTVVTSAKGTANVDTSVNL
jgi:hypothetical protein